MIKIVQHFVFVCSFVELFVRKVAFKTSLIHIWESERMEVSVVAADY